VTVLFVHGTGVRRTAYENTLNVIRDRLAKAKPGVDVRGCLWGDQYGVSLHANGTSIPGYATARAVETTDADVALWDALYQDPLAELRLVAQVNPPRERDFGAPALSALSGRLNHLELPQTTTELLAATRYSEPFRSALRALRLSPEKDAALSTNTPDDDLREALARSLVASTIVEAVAAGLPALDASTRDVLFADVRNALGGTSRSLRSRFTAFITRPVLRFATSVAVRRRGAMSDVSSPVAGDVVLYQVRGEPIRAAIRECIAAVPGPVTLLAHSLGGIACVDLLASSPIDRVVRLITVGSQAPLFYELGALWSLPWGEPLPQHFPPWLNLWDGNDLLSYVGSKVFGAHVEDVEISSRQPFPESHSAYWTNSGAWAAIAGTLS
jgi:hypothetical protein